jgi:crotonobetainyl-CoA:carnitine CoA-transferase CaiB-like acyl-CoA transferase
VTIAVGTDEEWRALCRVACHPEWARDARFADQPLRHRNRQALDKLVEAWTRTEDRWELARQLQEAGVAATPMVVQEEFGDELALPAKGFFQRLEHPHLTTYPGPAARINGQELPLRLPPPLLGEHNEFLYKTLLGLSKEELIRLRDEQVM